MARPKKNQEGPDALQRLENAYWELLENTSQKPTVAAIAKKAQVNHNTFYYYFKSIDDMAEKMFLRNISGEIVRNMLPIITSKAPNANPLSQIPDAQVKAKRMQLMARSPLTSEKLRNYVVDMWLDALCVDGDLLTEDDWLLLTFISSGMVGVLKTVDGGITEVIPRFFNSPLAAGIVPVVKGLQQKGSEQA